MFGCGFDGIVRVLVLNDEILSGVAKGIKAGREAEESGVLQRTRASGVQCPATLGTWKDLADLSSLSPNRSRAFQSTPLLSSLDALIFLLITSAILGPQLQS